MRVGGFPHNGAGAAVAMAGLKRNAQSCGAIAECVERNTARSSAWQALHLSLTNCGTAFYIT